MSLLRDEYAKCSEVISTARREYLRDICGTCQCTETYTKTTCPHFIGGNVYFIEKNGIKVAFYCEKPMCSLDMSESGVEYYHGGRDENVNKERGS